MTFTCEQNIWVKIPSCTASYVFAGMSDALLFVRSTCSCHTGGGGKG